MRRKVAAGEVRPGQPFETVGGLRMRIDKVGRTWTERGLPVCFAYLEPWPVPMEVQSGLPSLMGSKNTAMEAAHQRDIVLRWLWATRPTVDDPLWVRLSSERRATWWMSAPSDVLELVRVRIRAKR
jgi:hypothetical protein